MTTTLMAMPIKMTTSARFFKRGDMSRAYPFVGVRFIDQDQILKISMEAMDAKETKDD